MITFFKRALKRWKDSQCNADPPLHFWVDEPVLTEDGKPTRIMITRCTNCDASYTWWRD